MDPVRETPMATWPDEPRVFARAGAFLVASLFGAGFAFRLFGGHAVTAAAVIGAAASIAVVLAGARRRRLSIGSDGVAIAGGARRFVPFADVERVERLETVYGRTHHLAELVLRSGERIRLGGRFGIFGHDALRVVDEAYDDLERALARHRARIAAEHAETLARGARPSAEWTRELRERVEASGFRQGTLAREDLVAVVEDPTADPTARAGAAYALRAAGLKDEERRRLRVAAAATAAPKVRVALEAAADEHAADEQVAAIVSRLDARRRA